MDDVVAAGLYAFGLIARGSNAAAIAVRRAVVAREDAAAMSTAERLARSCRPSGGSDFESVPA